MQIALTVTPSMLTRGSPTEHLTLRVLRRSSCSGCCFNGHLLLRADPRIGLPDPSLSTADGPVRLRLKIIWSEIGRSGLIVLAVQAAPEPLTTAGMVRARILRSSQSDHLSMYWMSNSIHLSNGIKLRPLTCHKQVMPGFTLKRRRCQSWSNN